MGFQDEEIIKKKKELEQQKKLRESQDRLEKEAEESIYDEIVHIIGEEVHFQRREIPDLKISIYMPETFFLFTDDVKHLVYPGANAPTHVFGGENINFQMSFHQTEHIVPDDGMKKFMDITADLMKAVGPRVTIIEKSIGKRGFSYWSIAVCIQGNRYDGVQLSVLHKHGRRSFADRWNYIPK